MSFMTSVRKDFKQAVEYGEQIRIMHFTGSKAVGEYDDADVLIQSGASIWTSGLVMPITNKYGSSEALLLEQGKIKTDDKKIFIAGDIETTNTMRIGIGNPVTEEHSIIADGVTNYPAGGEVVYKKLYCRVLGNGSLTGET